MIAGDTHPVGQRAQRDSSTEMREATGHWIAGSIPTEDRNTRDAGTQDATLGPREVAGLMALDGNQWFPLRGRNRVVIGRDENCDLQLELPNVSGKHCELSFDGQCWRITDLNSKNGSCVNDVETKRRRLRSGDRVTVASMHRFQFLDPHEKTRRDWLWLALLGGVAAVAAILYILFT